MNLLHLAQAAVGRLVVRSALNPLLWMCAIIGLPFLWAVLSVRDDRNLMWTLLAIGTLPIVVTSAVAVGFAIFKPEKLQSEDYQLRHQSIQMLQGRKGPHVIEAVAGIANPAAPALPVVDGEVTGD